MERKGSDLSSYHFQLSCAGICELILALGCNYGVLSLVCKCSNCQIQSNARNYGEQILVSLVYRNL